MFKEADYIPALGYRWLTPIFDPVLRWMLPEETLKQQLIQQANVSAGHRVLDLGCGTGTLTVLAKQTQPEAEIIGVDADPDVLALARKKIARAGVRVTVEQGSATQLPYPDQTFDRVISSLVVHHLNSEAKRQAFMEVERVLRPGGEFHILDFGWPRSRYAHFIRPFARHLEQTADNLDGRLPEMLRSAGLRQVVEVAYYNAGIGTLSFLRAQKGEVRQ